MEFEITNIELKKNRFGKNDLIITKVKVLDDKGKYIKFAKLDEALLSAIKEKGTIKIKKNGK